MMHRKSDSIITSCPGGRLAESSTETNRILNPRGTLRRCRPSSHKLPGRLYVWRRFKRNVFREINGRTGYANVPTRQPPHFHIIFRRCRAVLRNGPANFVAPPTETSILTRRSLLSPYHGRVGGTRRYFLFFFYSRLEIFNGCFCMTVLWNVKIQKGEELVLVFGCDY